MRLAFMGASGTGKSTLAQAIATEMAVPVCPVGSRSVAAEMGLASPYEVDALDRRMEFQLELLRLKLLWELKHGAFVTDRTPLDNLAYTQMHAAHSVDESFKGRVYNAMRVYTHVVFCPISSWHDTAGDPQRVADLAYHQSFEDKLVALMRSPIMPEKNILWLGQSDLEARLRAVRLFVAP